jgi:hypothetical protein
MIRSLSNGGDSSEMGSGLLDLRGEDRHQENTGSCYRNFAEMKTIFVILEIIITDFDNANIEKYALLSYENII